MTKYAQRKITDGKMQCTRCKGMFDLDNFLPRVSRHGTINWAGECNPCRKLRNRLHNLNLPAEDYWQMMWDADGRCQSCGVTTDDLAVDHEHKHGRLRGMICSPCNVAIGYAQENAARLQACADYLNHHATLLASRPPTPQDIERERRMGLIRERGNARIAAARKAIKRPSTKGTLDNARLGRQFTSWSRNPVKE